MRETFNEHKCPICHKKFIPTPMWVYKRADRPYCSYKCVNEYDRREEGKKKTRKLSAMDRAYAEQMIRAGKALRDIAQTVGVSYKTIAYYRDRMTGGFDDGDGYAI